jgi:hypothetical protein
MRAIHRAIHFDVTSFCVLRIEMILLHPSHRAWFHLTQGDILLVASLYLKYLICMNYGSR